MGFDPEAVVHARFIVAWGANIVSSNVHLWPFIEEARRRGAQLVTIDPYRSRTAEKADQHLALLPGTDAALALGVMHVIFRDGLEDRDYLERYTRGRRRAARARARVDAARARREVTGLTAAEVDRGFAREYATTQPSALRINYGLNRHAGAGMAVRTIACLPALTGAWRHAGRRRCCSRPRARSRSNNDGPGAARPDPARHAHAQHEPARPHPARPRRSTRR